MSARMPTLVAAVVLFATPAAPAVAQAPGQGHDATPRFVPQSHRDRLRQRLDHDAGPPDYGPRVRADLPRNVNLPIYNEPPAR